MILMSDYRLGEGVNSLYLSGALLIYHSTVEYAVLIGRKIFAWVLTLVTANSQGPVYRGWST